MAQRLEYYKGVLRTLGVGFYDTLAEDERNDLEFKSSIMLNNQNPKGQFSGFREILSKSIAGFGNAIGGVLVIGLDDKDKKIEGIEDQAANDLKKWINEQIRNLTYPPHPGVEVELFSLKSQPKKSLLAVFIPTGSAPPYCSVLDGKYYLRVGSSFGVIPPNLMGGFFGKSTYAQIRLKIDDESLKPVLGVSDEYTLHFSVSIINESQVIAKETYLNFEFLNENDAESVKISRINSRLLECFDLYHKHGINKPLASYYIAKEIKKLAPFEHCQMVSIKMSLKSNKARTLSIKCTSGCSDSPTNFYEIKITWNGSAQAAKDLIQISSSQN